MTELTQALIGAAQAATLAASQAAQATASQSMPTSGGESGGLKKDLAKLIPRPQVFNPADREQEVLQWRDWFWSLEQYLVVVDGSYQEELEKMEANPTTEYDWDLLSDEDRSTEEPIPVFPIRRTDTGQVGGSPEDGGQVQWLRSPSTAPWKLPTPCTQSDDEFASGNHGVSIIQHEELTPTTDLKTGRTLHPI